MHILSCCGEVPERMCHTGGASALLSPASGREWPGGFINSMSQQLVPWVNHRFMVIEEKNKRLWGRTHQIMQNPEGRKQIRQRQGPFNGTQYKTRSNGLTPKHRRCHLIMRKNFFTVRVTKHWHCILSIMFPIWVLCNFRALMYLQSTYKRHFPRVFFHCNEVLF